MTLPTVSVIVVSQGRPDALLRCLAGIAQLDYPHFEVIVVADETSVAIVPAGMKAVVCQVANISVARNLGIAAAGGDIVAFIDDDAVPEPTWLTFLCQPFADTNVDVSGGFVIGRNGISFQWQARMAFPDGSAVPMDVDPVQSTILKGEPGRAIKTEGTNMAFRRDRLMALGGFDPAFAFYLDETDVNMRFAAIEARTAIVPRALVHHGFAESTRRTAARVPRDLSAIGRSLRAFVTKHDPTSDLGAIYRAERTSQRRRLLTFMRDGHLVPGDVRKLLRTFDKGWDDPSQPIDINIDFDTQPTFEQFQGPFDDKETVLISGRFWQSKTKFAQAQDLVAQGRRVTVILLSFSNAFHHVFFDPTGFWVQTGGQFGKSDRSEPFYKFWGQKPRIRHEIARNSDVRKLIT